MKLNKNIQMRDYTQVNGYADEKLISCKKRRKYDSKKCYRRSKK